MISALWRRGVDLIIIHSLGGEISHGDCQERKISHREERVGHSLVEVDAFFTIRSSSKTITATIMSTVKKKQIH